MLKSKKIYLSLITVLISSAYSFFLFKIWIDTEFSVPLISEAYGDMSLFELVYHSYQYLTWFVISFGIQLGFWLYLSGNEKLKSFLIIWTVFWILTDIASVWLIGRSEIFSIVLFVSGLILAVTHLTLFIGIQSMIYSGRTK